MGVRRCDLYSYTFFIPTPIFACPLIFTHTSLPSLDLYTVIQPMGIAKITTHRGAIIHMKNKGWGLFLWLFTMLKNTLKYTIYRTTSFLGVNASISAFYQNFHLFCMSQYLSCMTNILFCMTTK